MKKLATNTTVGDKTYPAGTEVSDEVAKLIDNPKAWGVEAEKSADVEPDESGDEPADEQPARRGRRSAPAED